MLKLCLLSVVAAKNMDPLSWDKNLKIEETSGFVQNRFETMLDHQDKTETKKFTLRFWENNDYFDEEEGPIFLYICGEWTCSPPSVTQAAYSLGIKLKGRLMTLEHRYYGDSQPFTDEQGGWSS